MHSEFLSWKRRRSSWSLTTLSFTFMSWTFSIDMKNLQPSTLQPCNTSFSTQYYKLGATTLGNNSRMQANIPSSFAAVWSRSHPQGSEPLKKEGTFFLAGQLHLQAGTARGGRYPDEYKFEARAVMKLGLMIPSPKMETSSFACSHTSKQLQKKLRRGPFKNTAQPVITCRMFCLYVTASQ